MTPTVDLIASELARHSSEGLYEAREPTPQDHTPVKWWDTGGLRCTCGDWQSYRVGAERGRPRREYNRHVADAITRRLGTPDAKAVLESVYERLLAPRVGVQYMRVMDRDLLTLRAVAAYLTVLLNAEATDVD